MSRSKWNLVFIIIAAVVSVSTSIHTCSPEINKASDETAIQPIAPIDQERHYTVYFMDSAIDTEKVAKFFSVTSEDIRSATRKFKDEIPEGSLAIPLGKNLIDSQK